ncbi:MAG: hypothetical protein ACR2MY_10685 [Candidatus Dormibacteria bacterium]
MTLSGSRGSDRYAVPNAPVTLDLAEKPDDHASLSATALMTDVTGSAIARLTMSTTPGRHVIKASSGSLTNQVLIDTLLGTRASSGRAHHDGTVRTQFTSPVISPSYLFAAAGLTLLISFLLPYRRRLFRRHQGGRATPVAEAPGGPTHAVSETSVVPTGPPARSVVPTSRARRTTTIAPSAAPAKQPAAAAKLTPARRAGSAVPISSGRKTPRAPRSAAPDA